MQTWTSVNKSTWGDGPWQDEADKYSWTDEVTGVPCLIVRNPGGALCGYAGIEDPTHPWYGKDYDDEPNPDVHGGLTFADFCQPILEGQSQEEHESHAICHVPEPGRPDRVWWLGFDTAHAGDLCPAYDKGMHRMSEWETYKDAAYVQSEVAKLAQQIKEMM